MGPPEPVVGFDLIGLGVRGSQMLSMIVDASFFLIVTT